jgi:recombinational DNA repair protein (RecF pathway)
MGESDRVYALFTREFGLVRARAGAVRAEYSKMRYALQTSAHVDVSLVKGRRGWRAAGATTLAPLLANDGLRAFVRTGKLITRLVVGEEQNEYLYDTLSAARSAYASAEQSSVVELLSVARVLYALGYISAESLGTALFTHTSLTETSIAEAAEKRNDLLTSVNKALSEAQL